MRLVTYARTSGRPRVGIVQGGAIVDPDRALRAAAEMRHPGAGEAAQLPTEMVAFFEAGPCGRDLGALALELVAEHGPELTAPDGVSAVLPADTVRLLAPVPRPRRMRDYLTYNGHAAGSGLGVPAAFTAMPICYKCNTETVVGPNDPLLWPSYTGQLDFELELGFFTSGGLNLTSGEAAGRQFSFAEVLAWASLDEPVYPGEFFAVGTVGGGCGLELDRRIQPDDVVELEASGVGVLRNPVGPGQVAPPGASLPSYTGAPRVGDRH